jgi:hypothetical protein
MEGREFEEEEEEEEEREDITNILVKMILRTEYTPSRYQERCRDP